MRFTLGILGFTLLIHVAFLPNALGQANYVEGFDNNGPVNAGQYGPANLIAQGWIFRMQSSPASALAFVDGYQGGSWPVPQAGSGYLGADLQFLSEPPAGGSYHVSNWAILPAIANQVAGDRITLWVQRAAPWVNMSLQIRYSPSGGTSTGTGTSGTGSFNTTLLNINPIPNDGSWMKYSATVPGGGRLALRYFRDYITNLTGGVYSGIDTLTVGPPQTCAAYPPVPDAGETVTWTAANSPYQICDDVTIPHGATVIVEPGVTVNIDPGRTIVVDGTLRAQGNQAGPITFNGNDEFGAFAWVWVNGLAEFNWCTINCPIGYPSPNADTAIVLRDSTILANDNGALGLSFVAPSDQPATIVVERCNVIGSGDPVQSGYRFNLHRCHGSVRDTTINGVSATFDGYLLVDNVTSAGAPQAGMAFGEYVRDLYINDVTVTEAAGPALDLSPVDRALLGPDNVLQGSQYAVVANSLLPGSVVPAAGNAFNHVLAAGSGPTESTWIWPKLDVPWAWNGSNYGVGPLRIEPGVTVLMYPRMFMLGPRFSAEGLPDAPILFTPLDPAQPWCAIQANGGSGHRFEYCIVEEQDFVCSPGAFQGALLANSTVVNVDNCLVRNNWRGTGAASGSYIQARKTRFLDNTVGAYTSSLSGFSDLSAADAPNSFEDNDAGVFMGDPFVAATDARHCWWGDPTGPQAPQNPGGQGDPVAGSGADDVLIFPYLTAPPDFNNHPPVVRIPNETFRLETGSKYILQWTAEDDDRIVEQRIEFAQDFNLDSSFQVIAAGLPADQRAYELTVPDVPLIHYPSFIRVVAIDSQGQEGRDEFPVYIPSGDLDENLTITSDFDGQTFRSGQHLPAITWTPLDYPYYAGFAIELGADDQRVDLGGWNADAGSWEATQSPFASTDTARIVITIQDNGNNQQMFFGKHFSLRPNALIGDAPPTVQLLSPQGGSFPGGGIVPIAWTASDDESVRAFNIQASYDGGRLWHTIVRDLPARPMSYDWQLPPSTGIPDVRVRVIAKDLRLQNSSSTGNAFSIAPGSGATAAGRVPADLRVRQASGGGGQLTLDWSSSCLATDTDYAIYEGKLGLYYSHVPRSCSTGGATTQTFTPQAEDSYYLVVPGNGVSEGSYGTHGGGFERPPGQPACLPQQIGLCP